MSLFEDETQSKVAIDAGFAKVCVMFGVCKIRVQSVTIHARNRQRGMLTTRVL